MHKSANSAYFFDCYISDVYRPWNAENNADWADCEKTPAGGFDKTDINCVCIHWKVFFIKCSDKCSTVTRRQQLWKQYNVI